MPYKLYKSGSKTCVRNSETGESKGCSDTRAKAVAHMRALYAVEGGAKMGKKELSEEDLDLIDLAVKEAEDNFDAEFPEETDEQSPDNPETPAEVAEEETLPDDIYEVDGWYESEEKAISKRSDVSEADKKRAVGEYGKVTYADPKNKKYPVDNEKHIRAAWSYINMPRNASKYSSSEVSAIKRRIVSAWKRVIDKSGPPQAKKEIEYVIEFVALKIKEAFGEDEELSIFDNSDNAGEDTFTWYDKETGKWRWMARYSNKFRDRDDPPEIISSNSHRRFVERVEKGLAPYPELWLWHIKNWRLGKADWVAYDDSGFAMAAGTYNPGCEQVAEWLSHQKGWAVSHGMPPHIIKRDETDPTIIVEHETREISFLPRDAAANLLTDFISLKKEEEMAIPDDKKKTLIESWGMSPELLAKIEQQNAEVAEKATAAGLESKEKTKEEAAPAAESEPTQETPAVETPPAETPAPLDLNAPASRKETAEAFAAIVTPFVDEQHILKEAVTNLTAVVKELSEQMSAMKVQLAEKEKTQEERVKETLQGTPIASLAALITQSAVGAKETQVDGRSSLAQSKPKETEVISAPTGIPLINSFLTAKPKETQEQ